jgi:ferredoxin-type protein NapG
VSVLSNQPIDSNRRKFFRDSLKSVGGISLIAMAMGIESRQSYAKPTIRLRPPGALQGKTFDAACIRCGLCVQACPFNTLKLSRLGNGDITGLPYFEARDVPCEMCEDIPCVVACPSGALDPALTAIDTARMGTAVLISPTTCLSVIGLRCDVCFRVCPLIEEAITLPSHRNQRTGAHAIFVPTVNPERCTGCGKCEQACVLDVAAIKVFPLELAQGAADQHYRLGWQEKQKAGHSLVPSDRVIPIRRPEGNPTP